MSCRDSSHLRVSSGSPLSNFPVAVSFSVTAEEFDTPSVSRLLYFNVKLEQYSRLFQALVDCGSVINPVHENVLYK